MSATFVSKMSYSNLKGGDAKKRGKIFYHENTKVRKHEKDHDTFRVFQISCFRDGYSFLRLFTNRKVRGWPTAVMPDLLRHPVSFWIPAFAGMTPVGYLVVDVIRKGSSPKELIKIKDSRVKQDDRLYIIRRLDC